MKKCPNCQKTFDDDMKFCQSDGTALVVVAENKPKADPYATMVSNVVDLDIPPVEPKKEEPKVEAKKEEPVAEVKIEEPKAEPEVKEDPYETMVANTPIVPKEPPKKEEDVLDVLDDSDEEEDPMKTMIISGNTADNIKLNIPEDKPKEKPKEKPQSTPTNDALKENRKQDESEAKTMMSPQPPKFNEPKIVPPDIPAPPPPPKQEIKDTPPKPAVPNKQEVPQKPEAPKKPEAKETAPKPEPPKKTPSSPFDAEKPKVEPKPPVKDTPSEQNSAPIPSPFDNSMPPGYAPPSTPPFEPPKEALKPSALNVDKKKDAQKPPFAADSNKIAGGKIDDLNVASAPMAGSGGKNVPANAPFDNSAMPSSPPAEGDGQNQTLAIVSLVFGILSIPCCTWVVFSVVAIITGIMAKKKAQENPAEYGGETFAKVGMITGVVTLVLGIIVSVIYVLVYIGMINF